MASFETGGNGDNDNEKPSNVVHLKNFMDDPTAVPQFALDALDDLNEAVASAPEIGITQREVDEEVDHYLRLAEENGIVALEDELEKMQMTDVIVSPENRDELVNRIGLTTAYLRFSGHDM